MIKSWALSCLVLAAGCSRLGGDPKEAEVREGVALVQRLLNGTRRNMMAGLAFASQSEQGGGALSYVAANLSENAKFTCYVENAPNRPYCVSIRRGAAPNEFIIEGYGQSLEKPIVVEKAVVGMPPRPNSAAPGSGS